MKHEGIHLNTREIEIAISCFYEVEDYLINVLLSTPEDEWFRSEEEVLNCLKLLWEFLKKLEAEKEN